MDLGQIFSWALGGVAVLGTLIEITPIKINPLSAILRWVGNKLNADIKKDVSGLSDKLEEVSKNVDQNEVDRLRWEILEFSNSCQKKERHTKDEFSHILDQNQKYHAILKKLGKTNGKIDLEMEYIEKIYKKCCEENSFL